MKKAVCITASVVCAAVFLSGCGAEISENINQASICGQNTAGNDIGSEDYELYLENDDLYLYMNPDTTEIRVVNKKDGSVWNSSNGESKNESSRAVIELSYLESTGTIGKYDSFQNSVANGQYRVESEDSILSVHYSIGNFTEQILIPEVISAERYEELCSNLDDEFDLMKFQNYYYFYDPKKENSSDDESGYTKRYPILKEKAMYVINDSVLTSYNVRSEFSEILTSAGYTPEMYEQDKSSFNGDDSTVTEPGFNITVEYILDGSDLIVSIPNDKIEMYSDFPLIDLTLMKYFGSPASEESGYFLLPDGSGSVMNFYNNKSNGHQYQVRVYGTGYSLANGEKTSNFMNASLPVYGVHRSGAAMFAEITGGDSIAEVIAYPGDFSDVPYAGVNFNFRETYTSVLASGRKEASTVVQKRRYSGDLSVRYSFLQEGNSDYNAMAELYRQRIFENKEKTEAVPLNIEFIGMIGKQGQKLGVQYTESIAMTDFEQVYNLSKCITEKGISNINVRLSGWFGGGLSHSSITGLRPEGKLGGSKGFNELTESFKDSNIAFYPDADIQYTASAGNSSAIRMINKAVGTVFTFDPASFVQKQFQVTRIVNNSGALRKEANAYLEYAESNQLSSLSLRNIGSDLNADYNENSPVDAGEAKNEIIDIVKKLSGKADLMTNGANAYVLPYIKSAVNLPLDSNGYDCTDYSVPFLMMVLKGYVNYSGKPVNLSGDIQRAVLNSAQTGAGLYFILTAENSEKVIKSDYDSFYSTGFNVWENTIADSVKQYCDDFACVADQRITGFRWIEREVSETVFENGAKVFVNFGENPAIIEEITIAAGDYLVVKG